MAVTIEALKEEFAVNSIVFDKHEKESLSKCLEYCVTYNLSASDLVSSWDKFSIDRGLGFTFEISHMDGLHEQLLKDHCFHRLSLDNQDYLIKRKRKAKEPVDPSIARQKLAPQLADQCSQSGVKGYMKGADPASDIDRRKAKSRERQAAILESTSAVGMIRCEEGHQKDKSALLESRSAMAASTEVRHNVTIITDSCDAYNELLYGNVDYDAQIPYDSPIMLAVYKDNVVALKEALGDAKNLENINKEVKGFEPPIHYAYDIKARDCFMVLMYTGLIHFKKPDGCGHSILHKAALRGDLETLKYVFETLSKEADAELLANLENVFQQTPLHTACMGENPHDTVTYLLRKGASPMCRDENDMVPAEYIKDAANDKTRNLLADDMIRLFKEAGQWDEKDDEMLMLKQIIFI